MCQYQGKPFEWQVGENGIVFVTFHNRHGEIELVRQANQEELALLETIKIMRKVSQAPYVLKYQTSYSLEENYYPIKRSSCLQTL